MFNLEIDSKNNNNKINVPKRVVQPQPIARKGNNKAIIGKLYEEAEKKANKKAGGKEKDSNKRYSIIN